MEALNMEKVLNKILEKLTALEEGQKSLEEGQKSLEKGQKSLEEGQKSLEERQKSLEEGQKSLEEGQKITNNRLTSLEKSVKNIENVLNEGVFKDIMKHESRIEKLEKKIS